MQFVIRELADGPADLRDQLPVTLSALNPLSSSTSGQQFWCAQLEHPVKYRFSAQNRPDGMDPGFVDEDHEGTFLWVYVLVLTNQSSADLQAGMHAITADVGYVTDLSLGSDTSFDSDKVRWVAEAQVDVEAGPGSAPATPPADTAGSGATGALGTFVDSHVQLYLTQLAALAGTQFSDDIPRAVQISEGQDPPAGRPAYVVAGTQLRYHTLSAATNSWGWRTTDDPDQLVYWILDDLVRSLAYRWATTAPAATLLDKQGINTLLWIPYWLTLLAALNPQWRSTTEAAIREWSRES